MNHFANPGLAIAFGAFFLCAETCLHADSVLDFASRPFQNCRCTVGPLADFCSLQAS